MKKTNLAIATLVALAISSAVNAEQTTTTNTTESYTYTKGNDGSITSSQKTMTSERKTDKEILKILDAKIDGFSDLDDAVSFTVQNGVVTFKGKVKYASQKDHVRLLAEAIPGVVRVDNLIDIK